MNLSREDMARRLAQADRILTMLRRCTRDMQAMGRHVRADPHRKAALPASEQSDVDVHARLAPPRTDPAAMP